MLNEQIGIKVGIGVAMTLSSMLALTMEQSLVGGITGLSAAVVYLFGLVYSSLRRCERDRKDLWEENRKIWMKIAKDN